MAAAFGEAARATTQPCTLLLVLPAIVLAVVTRGRFAPLAGLVTGAVLGGWLFVANVIALTDVQLRLTGVVVAAAVGLLVGAPSIMQLRWAQASGVETVAAGAVSFLATLWWRPCVGPELGAILTGARSGIAPELPGITAYMVGAMLPVAAVAFFIHTLQPGDTLTRRLRELAGAVGVVVGAALALGRHDELVAALSRWTTS